MTGPIIDNFLYTPDPQLPNKIAFHDAQGELHLLAVDEEESSAIGAAVHLKTLYDQGKISGKDMYTLLGDLLTESQAFDILDGLTWEERFDEDISQG
jgi:hypothetical protein